MKRSRPDNPPSFKPKPQISSSMQLPHPLPSHPRLLADPGDWERLKQQILTDPASARIFKSLEKKAATFLIEPFLEREIIGRRLLYTSRKAIERIATLSMVARVRGDDRYARRAIDEMISLARFSDWNPSHYLDVAEMTLAMALGYDWLHHHLSAEEQDAIADALLEKGIKPSFAEPEPWFIRSTNNWNQVCHAGMVASAIVLADREPDISLTVIKRAVDNLPMAAQTYAPDGAYPEGPMYWNYGTSFHVILAAALQRFTGSTQGTDAYPGFKESADYVAQMTRPDGNFYCYSDCRNGRHLLIPLFWFARHFQRPDWMGADLADLEKYMGFYDSLAYEDSNYRLLSLALLWHQPVLQERPSQKPSLHWSGDGIVPISVHRSSFDDTQALYAAIKGGSPSASHGHMDSGSFFLQSDGVVWALDLGMQDYESLESLKINLWDGSKNGERWKIFRLGPESHNILRFNGANQVLEGKGTIVDFKKDGPNPYTVVDLGSIYSGQVAAARRGLMFVENRAVLIQDEWMTGDAAVDVTWQMLTASEIAVESGIIHLRQEGKGLDLKLVEARDALVEVTDVSLLQKPFDAPNPGVRRLTIRMRTEAGQKGKIRILALPQVGENNPGLPAPDTSKLHLPSFNLYSHGKNGLRH